MVLGKKKKTNLVNVMSPCQEYRKFNIKIRGYKLNVGTR